jgi:hypothetical protein
MIKFEYRVEGFDGTLYEVAEKINVDKSLIGWELIGIRPTMELRTLCIFKRGVETSPMITTTTTTPNAPVNVSKFKLPETPKKEVDTSKFVFKLPG